jgi:5-methyltetrahydropteroyltriglutamate--homocysteine methyltransferase
MVGSYPRPHWFQYQLEGRDILEAWKVIYHQEAYLDATRTVILDQEQAGLDILSDGQMWFDDYGMGIGSFLWYWFERVGGFAKEKLPHPARAKAKGTDVFSLDEAGGVAVRGPIERGPLRLATLYKLAQSQTTRPIKACVGAGPLQL